MKFKMNNRHWEIKEKNQEEIKLIQNKKKAIFEENVKATDTRYYGITYSDDMVIYIDCDLPTERKRPVLIHELFHCYITEFYTHEQKTYNEEDICDISANAHDIIEKIVNKYFKKGK